jgi:hypothetical protein
VGLEVSNAAKTSTLTGTLDSAGGRSFMVQKAPNGDYVATVTSRTAAGYTWDTAKGVISATYTRP